MNIGVGPTRTSGLLEERVYVSRDNGTVFDPSTSVSVLSLFSRIDLAAPLRVGDTLDRTSSLLLPIVMAGDFYIHVQTNMNGRIFELNRENNIGHSARLTVFQTPPADLSVSSLTPDLPDERARSDRVFRVRVTVKNRGGDTWVGYWRDSIRVGSSSDVTRATTLIFVDRSGILFAGDEYTFEVLIQLPLKFEGTFYLFAQADTDNSVIEADDHSKENNIQSSGPWTLVALRPDLLISQANMTVSRNALGKQQVLVRYNVTNQGTGTTASDYRVDSFYLSTTEDDPTTLFVGRQAVSFSSVQLLPNQTREYAIGLVLPELSTSPVRYLKMAVGADADEVVTANNVQALGTVDLSPLLPFLKLVSFHAALTTVRSSTPIGITIQLLNSGPGIKALSPASPLLITVCLSNPAGSCIPVTTRQFVSPLLPGTLLEDAFDIVLPSDAPAGKRRFFCFLCLLRYLTMAKSHQSKCWSLPPAIQFFGFALPRGLLQSCQRSIFCKSDIPSKTRDTRCHLIGSGPTRFLSAHRLFLKYDALRIAQRRAW